MLPEYIIVPARTPQDSVDFVKLLIVSDADLNHALSESTEDGAKAYEEGADRLYQSLGFSHRGSAIDGEEFEFVGLFRNS